MAYLNLELEHVYGLTETYGPFTMNVPPPDFDELPPEERARLRARQGFAHVCAGEVRVVDRQMRSVPADGSTMGEVVMRGNAVMRGYFEDPEATERAFSGGWFHSGDIGVRHPDGSIELRDRMKDIIISGGAKTSVPSRWSRLWPITRRSWSARSYPYRTTRGARCPRPSVTLKPQMAATADEIIDHCRRRLAGFKVPKAVEFTPLPKTSTGKIPKHLLREGEWRGRDRRIN